MTKVESETKPGVYDMPTTVAIVATWDGSHYLIAQGLGGGDQLRGAAVRWEHGVAARVKPTDTLRSLQTTQWNDTTSLLDAVLHGVDESRPLMDWTGLDIARSAAFVGL